MSFCSNAVSAHAWKCAHDARWVLSPEYIIRLCSYAISSNPARCASARSIRKLSTVEIVRLCKDAEDQDLLHVPRVQVSF